MEGYLNKLGVKGIKRWKKRYFKQENSNLYYYRAKEKMDEPLGIIELFSITNITTSSNLSTNDIKIKSPWMFQLHTENRIYYMEASSKTNLDYWVSGIQNFIAKNTKKIHDIIDSLLRSYNSESETTISKGSSIENNNFEILPIQDEKANSSPSSSSTTMENQAQPLFLKDSEEDDNSENDFTEIEKNENINTKKDFKDLNKDYQDNNRNKDKDNIDKDNNKTNIDKDNNRNKTNINKDNTNKTNTNKANINKANNSFYSEFKERDYVEEKETNEERGGGGTKKGKKSQEEILLEFQEIENKAQKEKLKLLQKLFEENKNLKKQLKEKQILLDKFLSKQELLSQN
eukprot:TRINITY_DN5671_c0_g1_i1.p1 TRINITY_DN5671_c0_g1~~TRINITY_DN5671_c0_g1_i1.p1  ORF type:complete len:345 (-),score=124.29 TRINITY_DN5671_c0_g1_i1:38-1072(-)